MSQGRKRMVGHLRSHEVLTDAIQIVKCVIAGTSAWWLAVNVLESEVPFLAPWTALLTVHATIYRSLSRGLQTTVASAVGVGVSFLIGAFLGVNVWTFALALLVGMVGSRLTWIKDEGVAIATTAIFVLGSGFGEQAPLLGDRLLEVALGVGVGVVVNLLLIPPLRDRQAARYIDSVNRRMGEVLIDMAEALDGSWDTEHADAWVTEAESIDDEVAAAWQSVRFARESRRLNPRLHAPSPVRHQGGSAGAHVPKLGYEELLTRLGEGVSHLRHLARTLRESTYSGLRWEDDFREEWLAILRDSGHSIKNPDATVEPVKDRLDRLAARLSRRHTLPEDSWPTYGSLIASLSHIAVIVDDVASAREARENQG